MAMNDIDEWRKWEGTTSGRRGEDYVEAKEEKARFFIDEASKLFGHLRGMKILDIYTPLTIRDRVKSPGGSAYGILRSTGQLMKTASLKRTAMVAVSCRSEQPGARGYGDDAGSFQTVRQIIGHERFTREVMGIFCEGIAHSDKHCYRAYPSYPIGLDYVANAISTPHKVKTVDMNELRDGSGLVEVLSQSSRCHRVIHQKHR